MPARYEKTREIAAKYDDTADEHYDRRYKDVQFQKYDLLLAYAERLLGSDQTRGFFRDVVVDSGCGSGLLVPWLAERRLLGGMRLVGIDISAGMLAAARHKAPRRPGIDFIMATVELPPLRDEVAAVAFSVSTLQNLDVVQRATYIVTLRRVLRDARTLLAFSVLAKTLVSDDIKSITKQLHDMFSMVLTIPGDPRVEDLLFVCADP